MALLFASGVYAASPDRHVAMEQRTWRKGGQRRVAELPLASNIDLWSGVNPVLESHSKTDERSLIAQNRESE